MKIVCLEEHTKDADLSKATSAWQQQEAPYMSEAGSSNFCPADRPALIDPQRAFQLASEPLERRLAAMDEAGIDMQVISYSDSVQAASGQDAPSLAAQANDRLAAAIAKHPDRFAGFSTLPWQDTSAAITEAERCVRTLGLRATLLNGHAGEHCFVDDSRFEPILAKLAELNSPLYIHPGAPMREVQQLYYNGFKPAVTSRLSLFGWGWHNEAGVQVLRLILSGALDRYPALQIICGHWGEMVPFFLQRLDDMLPQDITGLKRSITQTFRDQVWVTPSGMLNLPHFRFIRDVLGTERILYSVDYPYLTMNGARQWLEDLEISEAERIAIASGNAAKLLGINL